MSVARSIDSVTQLSRLIEIGIVLEELVETRARSQAGDAGETVGAHLEASAARAAEHRTRLFSILADLDVDASPAEELHTLVARQYEADQEFDHVLYDHLCNVETAYKFYADLVAAVEVSTVEECAAIADRLGHLKADERREVETTTDLLEEIDVGGSA